MIHFHPSLKIEWCDVYSVASGFPKAVSALWQIVVRHLALLMCTILSSVIFAPRPWTQSFKVIVQIHRYVLIRTSSAADGSRPCDLLLDH